MNLSEYNIQSLKGVGDKTARLYNKLGIYTLHDLIHYYPRKYVDWGKTVSVKDAVPGETVFIRATMITPVKENLARKGMTLYKCNFSDGESVIHVTIFNNKYLAKSLRTFDEYILCGKIERNFTSAFMSSPQIERADKAPGIMPVYHTTGKLYNKAIVNLMRSSLMLVGTVRESLDDSIRQQYNLCPLDTDSY